MKTPEAYFVTNNSDDEKSCTSFDNLRKGFIAHNVVRTQISFILYVAVLCASCIILNFISGYTCIQLIQCQA